MAHSDQSGNDASPGPAGTPSGEAECDVASLVSGFFHGGIAVSDMDRSLAFYRDLLELEVHFDVTLDAVDYVREALGLGMRDCRIVYLRVPGSEGVFVELLEYHGSDARATPEPRPWDPGTGHLCLYVSDTQAVLDRVIAAGHPTRSARAATIPLGPNRGALAGWLIDPDGYHIELFQRPPVKEP